MKETVNMHRQPSFPGAESKITSLRVLNGNYLLFLLLCFYVDAGDKKKWADNNYSGVFFAILKLPTCQELRFTEFEWTPFCVHASFPLYGFPLTVSGCWGKAIKLIDI